MNPENNTNLQRINYPELGLPVGPYTHAVIHQNVLYTSGMTAFGSDAQNASIHEQTKEIFTQLKLICDQQSTHLNKLIKVTLFVSDMTEINKLRQTLFDVYGEHIPASSLIQVDKLFSDDLKIEVEAIIAL